jgi:hypothetical protein
MDSRPFRLIRPWFAGKARFRTDPKMIQSKAMYNLQLSSSLIRCLRLVGALGRPTVSIIRAFADQWIRGHFGHIVLGSHARKAQRFTCKEYVCFKKNALIITHLAQNARHRLWIIEITMAHEKPEFINAL